MGPRFSKSSANNIAASTTSTKEKLFNRTISATSTIPIPDGNEYHQRFVRPTINLQIQGNPACSGNSVRDSSGNSHITEVDILHKQQHQQKQQQQQQLHINNSISSSLTSVNNLSGGRQIIIKIQLAKMENGNDTALSSSTSSTVSQNQHQFRQDTSSKNFQTDCNLNSAEYSKTVTSAGTQFLNLTLNSSSSNCNSIANASGNTKPTTIAIATTTTTSSSSSSSTDTLFRTASSSLNKNNNYLNSNSGMPPTKISERPERLNSLQFNDEIVEQNIGEIVEYCEVLEERHSQPQASDISCSSIQMLSINEEPDSEANVCCRRKSKSAANNSGSLMSSSSNAGAKTKSRCRKCSCREAFRRFLDPSLSRSSSKASKQQKEQRRTKSQDRHYINNTILNNTTNMQQQQQHSTIVGSNATSVSTAATTAAIVVPPAVSSQVSLWRTATRGNDSDVIIPLATPSPSQFVVLQCAIVNRSHAALHQLPSTNAADHSTLRTNNLISLATQDIARSTSSSSNELLVKVPSNSAGPDAAAAVPTAPIAHSQVDFVHYLVPDLKSITNSSFYWGKIDRYEAERLLEGKAEGVFLLRDSAQEEFLFSVTFRKYGRSLHARIEQSDHRFSFDCHDPCAFTASTVTGLLDHYKDPDCVMFFEPMLIHPLNRKNCFSLQKLCRATIVSNTSYDGINELELPAPLKSYLKEYHYKQKLRVKSNEPTYTIPCK